MSVEISADEFFQDGGTMSVDSPSYVQRPADDELFEQVIAGQFCYVLTARQMGKSSLMIRTIERLRQEGRQTAMVDLSGFGTYQTTPEQWYLSIVVRLARELRLDVDAEQWWRQRSTLSSVHRFTDFLHDVILAQIAERVVIFIDEIDSTVSLPFTDDFFAAIRHMYNQRASKPECSRLTFVLLGAATPTDLIKDLNRTPFNIGCAIDLQEVSRDDAQPLQDGLEHAHAGQGQRILDRIFYWTSGHPYLTQKICRKIAESPSQPWQGQAVDRVVEELFFVEDEQNEINLQHIRSSIEDNQERQQLLRLYQRVYEGKTITKADERSAIQNRLKVIGLVRTADGKLQVRNQIYRHVFGVEWIKKNINWSSDVSQWLAATRQWLAAARQWLTDQWQWLIRRLDQ